MIAPIDKEILKKELTSEKLVRPTNKGHNEVYFITAHDSPNVMREIGRLRELSYRDSGGGTGEEVDTDYFDYMEKPYKQLIVWNPADEEILGGFRFIHGKDMNFNEDGQPDIVTSHLFHYSDTFIKDYLPYSIDLGRAFVQPAYQSSKMGTKSLFAMDNLWDGLGAIAAEPNTKYFLGKISIYPHFDKISREMILYFIHKHYPDPDNLLTPKEPIPCCSDEEEMEIYFGGSDLKENLKKLQVLVRERGYNIPPLLHIYLNLSPTMRSFGSCINYEFSNLYETGLMITISEIFEEKKIRYIESYLNYRQQLFEPFYDKKYGKIKNFRRWLRKYRKIFG